MSPNKLQISPKAEYVSKLVLAPTSRYHVFIAISHLHVVYEVLKTIRELTYVSLKCTVVYWMSYRHHNYSD